MDGTYWRKCGTCKKEIPWGGVYQKCSVSSCRKFAYCSVDCWSVHDSVMGHMSAGAEEERAPNQGCEGEPPRRRIIVSSSSKSTEVSASSTNGKFDRDILIVASKLKKYVKDRHDLNTSANVMDKLSDLVRDLVDEAIIQARQDGRKTLMDRDF